MGPYYTFHSAGHCAGLLFSQLWILKSLCDLCGINLTTATMRKNPDHSATANGKVSPEALPWSGERAAFPPFPPLLGRPVLLRHPTLGRGMRTVAGLIVGTYAVDDRFVIVQAFPIGKVPVQFADVQLLDEDPGVTTDPVTWLLP